MNDTNSIPVAVCRTKEPVAQPLLQLLDELSSVIAALDDSQYVQRPVGVMSGSVGMHVRHWLDHVTALLTSIETGTLDYDQRERGTLIETDREAALSAIRQFTERVKELSSDQLDQPVSLQILLTSDGPPHRFQSSIGRELAYVVSHSVHHNAILGAMVQILGKSVPGHFGYAPATIAYGTKCACTVSRSLSP